MTDSSLATSAALAALAVYGLALAAWLLIRAGTRRASILIALLTPLTLLLIPAEHVAARSLTALVCVDLLLKLIDYGREMSRSESVVRFGDFVRFLAPFPPLMVVYASRPARSGPAPEARAREFSRLMVGSGAFVSIALLIRQCRHIEVLQEHFLLDHLLKFPMFIVAIEGLSQALCGMERLAGWNTKPIVNWSFLARTPAEFWVRYNQRVHQWFYRNVFVPGGGIRHPVRGVALVFLGSAALHEVGFGIATSRFDGYQFAFFALQIPAVLVSRPLVRLTERRGTPGTVLAHGVTIGWFFVTSMLFFHGGNRALPWFGFYASEPWLP